MDSAAGVSYVVYNNLSFRKTVHKFILHSTQSNHRGPTAAVQSASFL